MEMTHEILYEQNIKAIVLDLEEQLAYERDVKKKVHIQRRIDTLNDAIVVYKLQHKH